VQKGTRVSMVTVLANVYMSGVCLCVQHVKTLHTISATVYNSVRRNLVSILQFYFSISLFHSFFFLTSFSSRLT
jgi:hypothetical protein